MDNQKFGISQFAEQVNYQRALEGELEKTIASISCVKPASISPFRSPPCSCAKRNCRRRPCMVNLYPGRALDEGQILAIQHMVSSSVPDLPVKGVTIVDQDGNLLTQQSSANGLDASQLKYVQQIERNTQGRIDAILAPLFGAGNAHSQVSADIDFSKLEQTAESYGPNANPQHTAIRSQQSSLSNDSVAAQTRAVCRARCRTSRRQRRPRLLMHPPAAPTPGKLRRSAMRKDTTTNYEVDKHRAPLRAADGRHQAPVGCRGGELPEAGRREGHVTMQPLHRRQARAGAATGERRDGLR
jgi:flagellar M-ring protein FliF